jgi:hypothetical protein
MNCPHCKSVMYSRSEIHNLPDNTQRMDLHCWRDDCPTRKIIYRPHMGVLTRPNEVWECWDYHLPFPNKEKWYCLEGKQFNYDVKIYDTVIGKVIHGTTKIHQITREPDRFIDGYVSYGSISITPKPPLIDLDFIPLSTGDEMHIEAEKLFHRLIKLVPFT